MNDAAAAVPPDQPVPLMIRAVEQRWTVDGQASAQGTIARLMVQSPWSTHVLVLNEVDAERLIVALRQAFSGLTIAHALPSNGVN